MTAATINRTASLLTHGPDKAITLALTLAEAERAILAFTAGQADAIVDAEGRAYLLRPAQEQLRQSESRLQAILDHAPDVITVVDRGGMIHFQSQSVTRVLGYAPGELVGRSIFSLIHERDLDKLYTSFFSVIEGFQLTASAVFRHPTPAGDYVLIEATVARLGTAHAANVVCCLRPIALPRPAATRPPRPAAGPAVPPAKDRFLAMLSHELRTPLTPVIMGVQELEEDERFAEARPVLAMIRRNVDLQGRLLDELLEYTTVGQHKVRLKLEPINAHEHISYVMEICQSELTAAKITVLVNFGNCPPGLFVCADSARLQQIMWNLIKNAIKFSPPGSSISILTTDEPPGHLTIDISDQGAGIEPDLLPLVFDAFQQGSLPQQRAKGGLGLGLFIARGLAEAQDGTLTVHSEGSGLGSTFRLTLPKALHDHAAPPIETHSRFTDSALRPVDG